MNGTAGHQPAVSFSTGCDLNAGIHWAQTFGVGRPVGRMTQPTQDIRPLTAHATSLVRSGRLGEAVAVFRAVLHIDPNSIEALSFLGGHAFRAQRYVEARAAYERCVALRPGQAEFHFNLGTAREQLGDLQGAMASYLSAHRISPRDARPALFAGAALEAAGRREEAAVMFSLGDDVDPAMRALKNDPNAHPEMRRRAAVADRVFREHFTGLHQSLVNEAEAAATKRVGKPVDLSRIRRAIWVQTHDRPFAYGAPKHAPSIFYLPDLDARTIMPNERLPWVGAVEAATQAIREEYLAAASAGVRMSPYVKPDTRAPIWQTLRGNLDWSSLHLYEGARETPFARLFPRTLKALENADVVRVENGTPVEMFFSRLKPGTHIPPHFGACNNRLTVHLPLIVPDDCAIRVRDDVHVWREGEIFAFDDSFEHEAWNRSNSERVVLIFESHHPDLSADERRAIEHCFEGRGRWLRARRVPEAAPAGVPGQAGAR